MSIYLIHNPLKYLTITDEKLEEICKFLNEDIMNKENKKIKDEYKEKLEEMDKRVLKFHCVLRSDGKGTMFSDYKEMIKAFQRAKKVERVFITATSLMNTYEHKGKRIEIRFDLKAGGSYYIVDDDDNKWVDSIAKDLESLFEKYGNKYKIFYSWWFVAIIQLVGVFVIFLFCLFLGVKIAPYMNIDNPVLFAFIGLFLLCSNLWLFTLQGIKKLIDNKFPEIEFERKKLFWLWRGLMVAGLFYIILTLCIKVYNLLFKNTFITK